MIKTRTLVATLAAPLLGTPAWAVSTTPTVLTTSWQDLGTGPVLVQTTGPAVLAVADAPPAGTAGGFSFGTGQPPFAFCGASHVYARVGSVAAGQRVVAQTTTATCATGGGGGGGGGAITSPVGSNTKAQSVSVTYATDFLGQAAMAGSVPVVIASNQSSVPVTVGNFPTTQAVNQTQINGSTIATGTGASNAGTQRVALSSDSAVAVATTAGTVAQPVDVACGAATVCQLSSQTTRKYWSATNTTSSGYCRVGYGVTPTATRGDPLANANAANSQGGGRTFETTFVPQGTISAYCTVASTLAIMEVN